jgi:hypothetical protein
MSNLKWYGAKTIYKSYFLDDDTLKTIFEERVVLLRATDFDHAIAQAETEAAEYCRCLDDTEYLGYVNVYQIADATVGQGTEVYSLMRESDLSEENYLDHFYDDGKERAQKVK